MLENEENNNIRVPDATAYRKMTHKEHIYEKAGMYVGNDQQIERQTRIMIFDQEKGNRIVESIITLPDAIEQLFLEVLTNAGDNVDRSLRAGMSRKDIGKIEIILNKRTVIIRNSGVPIPVELHKKENIYVPELIFGNLLTSSNYDKNVVRTGAGTNGLGVKLVNVYSKIFRIIIMDAIRKLRYEQIWSNNMEEKSEPLITEYNEEKSYVEVTFELDFERFGYQEYPDESICLFARHAADLSFTCKVPVVFNEIDFDYTDINDYAKLYFTDKGKNTIVHYEWPEGAETVTKRGITYCKDDRILPVVELCVIDTPDEGTFISFVNGMWTREGGVHVNAAYKVLSAAVLDSINATYDKINKKKEDKNKKRPILNIADVKPHLSLVIACRLPNPTFVSQMKSSLSSPTPKINIADRMIQSIMKWDLVNRLQAALEAKQFKNLSKTDGKKKKHVNIAKLEDANDAGGKNSANCTLYIIEGKSAMNYAVTAISLVENGRDTIGAYPMKGKPLNVMNADPRQILENKEFNDLKAALGLREGVDYRDDNNFATLRYGHIVIMSDADDDGKHILGLILNYFHCRYPTLLARGYVMYLRTPIIRISKGKQRMKFYSEYEYECWKESVGNDYKSWKHKYCKGLGTSTPDDVKDDFQTPKIVVCIYDDSSPDTFKLAFDDKLADERKRWIAEHKRVMEIESLQMQPISYFLYYEFVEYSITNVSRSIPRLMDGLKESQRKAIWGAFKKWCKKNSNQWSNKVKTGNVSEFKVAQFAAFVAHFAYKHGEKCLGDAIVCMTHSFVGTNNLPYFTADGMLGSRNLGGEDAADNRYTYTRPQWWLPYVFKNEDVPLLTLVIDEGEQQEPITFLPIIPLTLVNGGSGIGTGHSTFIPPHNPIDICNWLKARINNEPLPTIIPWYRGFKGDVKITNRHLKKSVSTKHDPLGADHEEVPGEDISDVPEIPVDTTSEISVNTTSEMSVDTTSDISVNTTSDISVDTTSDISVDTASGVPMPKLSVLTSGLFTVDKNIVIITELPVGRTMHKYKNWLEDLVSDKLISEYRNLSGPNTVHFEIKGFKNPNLNTLRLQKSFGLSNMVLLDNFNHPIKYNSINDILECFFQQRLPYYEARKNYLLTDIQTHINKLNDKIRFIQAIFNKEIIILDDNNRRRKKSEIYEQMKALDIPLDLLNKTNLSNLTDEDVNSLIDETNNLINQYNTLLDTAASELWIRDLDEFINVYHQHYDDTIPITEVPVPSQSNSQTKRGRKSSKPRKPKTTKPRAKTAKKK